MNIVCFYQSMSGCGNRGPENNAHVIQMPRLHLFWKPKCFIFLFPIYSLFPDYPLFPIS